jgi:DNA-binding Lrp family transcriptional regulator
MVEKNNSQETKSGKTGVIHAYIFIQAEGGSLPYILEHARNFAFVNSVAVISGDSEVMVNVTVKRLEQLKKITDDLQMLKGVKQTSTRIVEKEVLP